jgi:hypothetical protein
MRMRVLGAFDNFLFNRGICRRISIDCFYAAVGRVPLYLKMGER